MRKTISLLMSLCWLACAVLSPIGGAAFAEEADASPSAAMEEQPIATRENAAATAPETIAPAEEPPSPSESQSNDSHPTPTPAAPDSSSPVEETLSPSENPSNDGHPTPSPAAPDSSSPAEETPSPSENPSNDGHPTPSPAAPDSSSPAEETPSPSENPSNDGGSTSTVPDESAPPTEETPPSATLTVTPPQDYQPQTWRNTAPTFTLSCDLPDFTGYAYMVSIDGGTPIQLEGDSYTPTQEGSYTLIFSLLDSADEIISQSAAFSIWLDITPPTAQFSVNGLALNLTLSDAGSGLECISLDGGQSWQPMTVDADGISRFLHTAGEAQTLDVGAVIVRDAAGNMTANGEALVLAPQERPGGNMPDGAPSGSPNGFSSGGKRDGASASGGVTRIVSHAASTVTDVVAYNGVALVVEDDAMTLLTLGGETLDLSARRVETSDSEPLAIPFTAELGLWNGEPTDDEDANTLILSINETNSEAQYEWLFNGKVSKTLAASGIDYLVLCVGERVTAMSTAGFTAGRAYDLLRSAGVASKAFEYRLRMTDDEREPLSLTVTVEDEQFLVTENPSDDFYYYDLYTGSQELLNTPFGAYSPMG